MPELHDGAPGLHGALTRHTGYLLSRLGMFASRRFAERLEELGLTPRMWGALNVVAAESPISQQRLGRSIGMDPSSVVGAIDELESLGMVERRPDPSDRRAHALYITQGGREALTRGRRLAARAQAELLAPLAERERSQLHELLLRVAEGASAVPSTRVRAQPGSPDAA